MNAKASSNYQPKGVREGRAAHDTAKATDSILGSERKLDLPGVASGGTLGRSNAEQERPYLAAKQSKSGKDRDQHPNEKVRELQRKLHVCAKQSKTRRFHALSDRRPATKCVKQYNIVAEHLPPAEGIAEAPDSHGQHKAD